MVWKQIWIQSSLFVQGFNSVTKWVEHDISIFWCDFLFCKVNNLWYKYEIIMWNVRVKFCTFEKFCDMGLIDLWYLFKLNLIWLRSWCKYTECFQIETLPPPPSLCGVGWGGEERYNHVLNNRFLYQPKPNFSYLSHINVQIIINLNYHTGPTFRNTYPNKSETVTKR